MLSRLVLYQPEVLYAVIDAYNAAIWPAQIAALLLALFAVGLLWRPAGLLGGGIADRAVGAILAAGWACSGLAWLGDHYATINWAGEHYRWAFVLQAGLLVWVVTIRRALRFRFAADAIGWAALALALFAIVLHPLVELAFGRGWTQLRLVGLMPDPTAVFTLALLAMARGRERERGPGWALATLAVIPVLWLILSGGWAWLLGTPERMILPLAGVVALALMAARRRRPARRDESLL